MSGWVDEKKKKMEVAFGDVAQCFREGNNNDLAQKRRAEMLERVVSGNISGALEISAKLIDRERAGSALSNVESKHFGYSIVQRILQTRFRELTNDPYKNEEMFRLVLNELRMSATAGASEPWAIKSKVAQITAEFIKRVGSRAWITFSETISRLLKSKDPFECELGAIVTRYVAEDVALHSEEVFADKVRDLLSGMTVTITEITTSLFLAAETHFRLEKVFWQQNETNKGQQHSNTLNAVLEAISVYAEWAPLVPFVRSGLVDTCSALLVR